MILHDGSCFFNFHFRQIGFRYGGKALSEGIETFFSH